MSSRLKSPASSAEVAWVVDVVIVDDEADAAPTLFVDDACGGSESLRYERGCRNYSVLPPLGTVGYRRVIGRAVRFGTKGAAVLLWGDAGGERAGVR